MCAPFIRSLVSPLPTQHCTPPVLHLPFPQMALGPRNDRRMSRTIDGSFKLLEGVTEPLVLTLAEYLLVVNDAMMGSSALLLVMNIATVPGAEGHG